jgi:hypothetical protein
VDWQILVEDGPACLPRNLGGEVRKRIGVVAGELISFAVMTCPDERGDRGLRVIARVAHENLPFPALPMTAPPASAPPIEAVWFSVYQPFRRIVCGMPAALSSASVTLCSTPKLIGETSAWRRLV